MTIPEPFQGSLRIDPPVVGHGLSSIGGPMFVLHENSELATEDADDPYAALNSESSAHAVIRPVIVPDFCLYLMFWHVWAGDSAIVLTVPRVRVYGKTPNPQEPVSGERLWPQDIADDSGWPDLSALGFWHPLQNADNVETPYHEIAAAPHMSFNPSDSGYSSMHLSERYFVYLAGCKEVLVTIDRAAILDSNGVEGMIVGRFTG